MLHLRTCSWLLPLAAGLVTRAPAQDQLDLLAMLNSGQATVETSAYDIGQPANIFDGDTGTLLRSASVNPLLVTLSFVEPQPVSRFRVWFLAGSNRWRVEGADTRSDLDAAAGSYRLLVPWTTGWESQWHEATAVPADTVSCMRLSLHRLTGDDYVHLNEWEIHAPSGWFRITDVDYNPATLLATLVFNSRPNAWYAVEHSQNRQAWSVLPPFKAMGNQHTWLGQIAYPASSWFFRVRPVAPEDRPTITKRILVLNYDPIIEAEGGLRLHEVLGWNDPGWLMDEYLLDLRAASHDYVDWEITDYRDIDEWPLKADGFRYTDESYLACMEGSQTWHMPDAVDYEEIIASQGLDELVQSGQVDEVLLWGAPYFGFWESQMVGGSAYWCNSPPLVHPGVPLYVIMGLNYERGVAEALHSFGHRAESILTHVYGSWSSTSAVNHDWDRFTRVTALHGNSPAGCGNVHFPVNGVGDYDYGNTGWVWSEAEDWLNHPDFQGWANWVNCDTWDGPDYHRNYLNWWMWRMPHSQGRGLDGRLLNWWGYLFDMNEYQESR